MAVPYVAYVTLIENAMLDQATFPGNLEFTRDLHLDFDTPVTFFVGENGRGNRRFLRRLQYWHVYQYPVAG